MNKICCLWKNDKINRCHVWIKGNREDGGECNWKSRWHVVDWKSKYTNNQTVKKRFLFLKSRCKALNLMPWTRMGIWDGGGEGGTRNWSACKGRGRRRRGGGRMQTSGGVNALRFPHTHTRLAQPNHHHQRRRCARDSPPPPSPPHPLQQLSVGH